MSPRELSFGQKVFIKLLTPIGRMFVGYELPFVEDLIATYGIRGMNRGTKRMIAALKTLEKELGQYKAQALVAFGAFWNGCPWCAVGHVAGANLVKFNQDGGFFLIDERELPLIQSLRDEEVLAELNNRAESEEDKDLVKLIERQYALKMGHVEPETDLDKCLIAGLTAWDWFNECSVMSRTKRRPEDVPILHPLRRKKDLVKRYHEARAPGRAQRGPKGEYYAARERDDLPREGA